MEKWVKALHSESEGSWFQPQPCYPDPGDLGVKLVTNALINMGLVTLPLDSGLTLAVG